MIKYRKITQYKYQLMEYYSVDIAIFPDKKIVQPFFELSETGKLSIRKGYAWDGASGPAINTESFMRASLVHDCIYQMLRLGLIHPHYRDYADRLLQSMCIEDGMNRVRAWYVYMAVKYFAKYAANPKQKE